MNNVSRSIHGNVRALATVIEQGIFSRQPVEGTPRVMSGQELVELATRLRQARTSVAVRSMNTEWVRRMVNFDLDLDKNKVFMGMCAVTGLTIIGLSFLSVGMRESVLVAAVFVGIGVFAWMGIIKI